MKRISVRDFRSRLAELVNGKEPVLVTRHGENLAVVYPLHDPSRVPGEVRRRVVASMTERYGVSTDESDPVIESYAADVDRTLIRENLKKTQEERLHSMMELQRLASEVRKARK